jgi:hypothetical protein
MNAYLRRSPASGAGHQQDRPVVNLFREWRWYLAQATSPASADALFAIMIAGSITELLKLVFG